MERLASIVRRLVLRVLPVVPVASKWTKLNPSVQFAANGILLHNVLPSLINSAFQSIKAPAKLEEGNDDLDPGQEEDIRFHKVQGQRVTRCRAFFSDRSSRLKVLVLALLMEPLQLLTSCLLSSNREVVDRNNPPLVLDLLTDSFSLVIVILQYLSSMLRGVAHRLLLILRPGGCSTPEELVKMHPDIASTLRAAISCVSTWVWRRHHLALNEYPWRLLALGDDRLDVHVREGLGRAFTECKACCLPPGFARQLRYKVSRPADLTEPRWQRVFRDAAHMLRLGIAGIERRHAWNRRHSGPGASQPIFISRFINNEAAFLQRARAEDQKQQSRLTSETSSSSATSARQQPEPKDKPKCAQSPLQLYRTDWLAKRRSRGASTAWSAKLWPTIKQDFAKLSREEHDRYEELAASSRLASRHAREVWVHGRGYSSKDSAKETNIRPTR